MKKKFSILLAICMLSVFALTACADDDIEEGGNTGASPTTSTAPGNGSNGDNGDSGTTGGANDSMENTNGAVTGEDVDGLGNGNGVNGSQTITPLP